jgi:hypothetical protein
VWGHTAVRSAVIVEPIMTNCRASPDESSLAPAAYSC